MENRQLWIVTDDKNQWLWCDRGTQKDAVLGARKAPDYDPDSSLHLYAVAAEIVLEPR